MSLNVPELSPEPLEWSPGEKIFICTKTRKRFYLVEEERVKVLETVERIKEKVR